MTAESIGPFLNGFVIFEGSFENLARVHLAKGWANSVGGQHPTLNRIKVGSKILCLETLTIWVSN